MFIIKFKYNMANKLYQKLIRQYSDDGGLTWKNVDPPVYQRGELLEYPSNCKSPFTKECRWSEYPSNIYKCNGTSKYYVEYEECTEDGQVWTKSGAERNGRLMQSNSPECGAAITKWVKLKITEGYICEGTNKYEKEIEYKSINNGQTWTPTGNERKGGLFETDSVDCGYVPPVGAYDIDLEHKALLFNYIVNGQVKSTRENPYKANLSDINITTITNCDKTFKDTKLYILHKFPITSSVTSMISMFENAQEVEQINLDDWDVSSVVSMRNMFKSCSNVTTLNFLNWKANSITDMNSMFDHTSSVGHIDLSGFNVSNVTDFQYLFNYCRNLKTLKLNNWHVSKQTASVPVDMFTGCNQLRAIELNDSDCDTIEWIKNSLKKSLIPLANINIITNQECGGTMTDYNIRFHFNTENGTYNGVLKMNGIDCGIGAGGTIDTSIKDRWGINFLTDCTNMFTETGVGTLIHLPDTSNVTTIEGMFYNAARIDYVELQTMNTNNVTNARNLFAFASKLMTIDMSGWNLDNCPIYDGMFNGCKSLRTIRMAACSDKTIKIVMDELVAAGIRDRVTVITYK